MSNGKSGKDPEMQVLEPLSSALQLGARTYQSLVHGIVSGRIEPSSQLRPDVIARQLEVSTTPVREALHHLETDGLVVKVPYQGWFIRDFEDQEIQALYEIRSALEGFGVRLACKRMTSEELDGLREQQAAGEAALAAGNMDAYRNYNRDLHAAIVRGAKNSYLTSTMSQLALQSEMLMATTIRLAGRPLRAIEEHGRLIELIAVRAAAAAERLMKRHILSAMEDVVAWSRGRRMKRDK